MMDPLGRVRRQQAEEIEPRRRNDDIDLWRQACQGFLYILMALLAAILLARYGSMIAAWVFHKLSAGFARDDSGAGPRTVVEPDCIRADLNSVVDARVSRIDVNIPRLTAVPPTRDWLDTNKDWHPTDLSSSFDRIVREHLTAPVSAGSQRFDFRMLAGPKPDARDLAVHGPSKIKEVLLDLQNFAVSRLNILRIQNYTDSFNTNYNVALQNADQCKNSTEEKQRELLALLNSHSARQSDKSSKEEQLKTESTRIKELEVDIERERTKQTPRSSETTDIGRQIEALQARLRDVDNSQ